MPDQSTIRIFISSPADVRPERLKAEQMVARLDREFAYRFSVEAVLWEREPLVASRHFQDPDNIPRPGSCDIVVVILWSRLGVPLPADRFRGAISGRPVTGTEWEFEDALACAREQGAPDLLLYRKTAEITTGLTDRAAVQQCLDQLDLIERFMDRWFRSESDDGYTAASHRFANTGEFEERLYEHLHALLARRAGAHTEGITIRWHEAPYRGLLSFDYEQAPVFFGRTRARNELRELLARQIGRGMGFLLVFGASGSGKSSLVKAGLLPDLMLPGMISQVALVRCALLRPSDEGNEPIAALAAAILAPAALPELAGLQYNIETLTALLREAPGQASLPIRQGLAAASVAAGLTEIAEARLIIIVDQLEELFTVEGFGQSLREAFVAALDALARSGLVWVVTTMRSDFFDRMETLPSLITLSAGEARYLLKPPDEAEIGQIIRQPALEAGLRFEVDAHGTGLDERIRKAAAGERGALPLLSFLLDQLWQRRTAEGLLTFASYEELDGLEGAIGRRAEEVFFAQPASVQRELTTVLRSLVTVEGGKATSRAASLAAFPKGSPRRALVEALLHSEARLLVSESGDGAAHLRLAHEALLSHWLRARDQVASDARDLELRARLEQEAERWRAAPRRPDKARRVVSGLLLAEARGLVVRWGVALPQEVREFVTASHQVARARRLRLAATITASVIAVPTAAFLIWAILVWWGVRQVEIEARFITIPTGCFEMGSSNNEPERQPDEGPVHEVCLKSFDLDQYEVTQSQWRKVMIFPNFSEPSYFKGESALPVEEISWNEAQRFLWLLSVFGHGHYRLPSEAEWEYAARAGTSTSRYWGDDINEACNYENIADQSLKIEQPNIVPTFAACDDRNTRTAPVGSYKPNPWGLYDMLGNVMNFVEDCYVDNYINAPPDGSPVSLSSCTDHVVRGGSWTNMPRYVRAADRDYKMSREKRDSFVGFRIVKVH
ncbi:MAG TPA: SUMF1/EgtB/PvdO family nonheme iron enzyme [Stellaceae bacterium]|jgi:formylglycine-generating enzyme required for sulfatase activity|nr:SUMF1/EgtB/PvdO family nonheme iron enzyme [Stellaceae bacterium]